VQEIKEFCRMYMYGIQVDEFNYATQIFEGAKGVAKATKIRQK